MSAPRTARSAGAGTSSARTSCTTPAPSRQPPEWSGTWLRGGPGWWRIVAPSVPAVHRSRPGQVAAGFGHGRGTGRARLGRHWLVGRASRNGVAARTSHGGRRCWSRGTAGREELPVGRNCWSKAVVARGVVSRRGIARGIAVREGFPSGEQGNRSERATRAGARGERSREAAMHANRRIDRCGGGVGGRSAPGPPQPPAVGAPRATSRCGRMFTWR
jgi:hypothetical protein